MVFQGIYIISLTSDFKVNKSTKWSHLYVESKMLKQMNKQIKNRLIEIETKGLVTRKDGMGK